MAGHACTVWTNSEGVDQEMPGNVYSYKMLALCIQNQPEYGIFF